MDTEVDVPNPSLLLIPGMYAEVDLTLDSRAHVVAVPIPAIDVGSDESSGQVYVVTPANQVEIRKVKLGLQTATEVEILVGVEAGEMVVIGNRAGLQAGQTVQPKITAMSTTQ